jgi:hypothetical protein
MIMGTGAGGRRGINSWLCFSALAVWLAVLGGAGRGFDLTDEGAYYLSAVHPEEVPDRQTTYFLFGRVLFALSGHNIVVTRALVAGLLLAATWLFVRGLRRFLAAFALPLDGGGWLAVGAMAGSALAFSISPVAPSYNLLNAICLLAIAGLALEGASFPAEEGLLSSPSAWLPPVTAGVLIVADFFIKFSTSVALAFLLTLFFLVTNRMRMKQKGVLLLGIVSLGSLAAAGYIFSVQSLAAWRDSIGGTLWAIRQQSYLLGQIMRYWDGLRLQVVETLWTYASVFNALFASGAVLLVLRRSPVAQRWAALAGLALASYLGFEAAPADLPLSPGRIGVRFHLAMICALGLAAGITWIVRAPGRRPRLAEGAWRVLVLLVILALLPFAGSFGTSNDINDNTIYQLAPWLALIAVLLAWLAHSWQARWLVGVGLIFVSAVTLSQFVQGYLLTPYRVPEGRRAQTVPTAIGEPATILRLNPASHDFIEAVRSQLESHGFKPGDDIFAFFNLPGLVFAMGGISPGHPWYFSGDDYSLILDDGRLRGVAPERRNRAFIVQNGDIRSFLHYMRDSGLMFPEAYEKCGPGLLNPLTGEAVQVWQPKGRK